MCTKKYKVKSIRLVILGGFSNCFTHRLALFLFVVPKIDNTADVML